MVSAKVWARECETYTTEGSGQHGGSEKNHQPPLELESFVVHRDEVRATLPSISHHLAWSRSRVRTWEDTSFKDSQEYTAGDKPSIARDDTLADSRDAPEEHESAEPVTRSDTLDDEIARYLEQDVRHEEDFRRNVVHRAIHLQVGREALDLGIPQIDSVKEGEHVQGEQDWDEMKVDLPQQSLFLGHKGIIRSGWFAEGAREPLIHRVIGV